MLCAGQLLARKRRPEIVPLRLLQQLHGPCLICSSIRRFDARPADLHHNPVAIGLQARQQLRDPSIAYPHLFGRLALA